MRPGASSVPLDAEGERKFSSVVFTEMQQALEREGLAKRVQLFLLNDPEKTLSASTKEARSQSVVLALPFVVAPDERKLTSSLMASVIRVANVMTIISVLTFSVGCYALNPKCFGSVVNSHDLSALWRLCFPLSIGLLSIQLAHELAHWIVARRRGMKIGLPLLLPSFQLGMFGCITPLLSFPPDRSALLDFALSGPIVSTTLSLFSMVLGCYKTVHASEAALMNFPTVSGAVLKSSFLCGSILTLLLPKAMMMPLSQPIPLHPLFLVGYSQLTVSALNLLPIFRLDGGRACAAVVGPRLGALASVWTLLSMLSFSLSGSRVAWTWGILVLFLQRRPDVSLRDEVTPVNKVRIGVWVSSLAVAVLSLLPFPGGTGPR
jgi:Zn-dependent protease